MARTPLLRSLVQLARDHQLAASRGLPVEALAEERARAAEQRQAVSRRRFLAAAGAGAAAATLPGMGVAHAAGQPRIAIVGGGIAGLSAALTLADAGIASTVYEATARVGGRMMSNSTYWNDGQVSEWCGELI